MTDLIQCGKTINTETLFYKNVFIKDKYTLQVQRSNIS